MHNLKIKKKRKYFKQISMWTIIRIPVPIKNQITEMLVFPHCGGLEEGYHGKRM